MRSSISKLSLSLVSLLSLSWACALEGNERPSDKQIRTGSTDVVSCPRPPKEIMNTAVQTEADVLVKEIGKIVKASGRVSIDPQRIRQELSPKVASFEVIDYRMCIHWANGVLDTEHYQKYLTDIAPTLLENQTHPGQGINQIGGANNVINFGRDVNISK